MAAQIPSGPVQTRLAALLPTRSFLFQRIFDSALTRRVKVKSATLSPYRTKFTPFFPAPAPHPAQTRAHKIVDRAAEGVQRVSPLRTHEV